MTFTLAGFRSRWTMPFSCAASSASQICLAMADASSKARAPRTLMTSASVVAFDEFEHEKARVAALLQVVDRGDVLMIQRRKRFRLPLKPADARWIPGEFLWQDLDGRVPFEPGVAHPVDLAHAALAEQRGDLIGPELLADVE
jgi:hypothetical protein